MKPDQQRDLYQQLHAKHGGTAGGLGYGSWRAQLKRFGAACEVAELRGRTALDVGCGYGDLAPFLVSRQVAAYHGIDVIPEFVDAARRRYGAIEQSVAFSLIDVLEMAAEKEQASDLVFALGTAGFADSEFFPRLLAACFRLAKVAAVVTVPTLFSPGFRQIPGSDEPVLMLHPADVAGLAADVTRRFTLRHDYLPTDQMLYLWKA